MVVRVVSTIVNHNSRLNSRAQHNVLNLAVVWIIDRRSKPLEGEEE